MPAQALKEQAAGELRLMPPTYVSLLELLEFPDCASLRAEMPRREPVMFAPLVTELNGELHFLYDGDAGFESGNPAQEGSRHRCIMADKALSYVREP